VVSNGGHIRDYEEGVRPCVNPHPPLMFVPTTSGTGSEVVGGTIIIDTSRQFKMHIVAVPGHVALCDPLLSLLADLRATLDVTDLCVGGGFFANTFFNTAVQTSGFFDRVFVPISPGNAGVAVGAALAASRLHGDARPHGRSSPFLGPEYDDEAIKATLDNCKLSYEFLDQDEAIIAAAVDVLARDGLVGWFQGRMEWGPRALGHRSILANPQSPYVLDNLNLFLRKRERHRGYGVSVCQEEVERDLCGPRSSPAMEYEYRLRRGTPARAVLPPGADALRVQTLDATPTLFRRLHDAWRTRTGSGMLVNTSLNAFHEPIACTPRDAVRVFYGTGLDLLVIGHFVVRK